MHKKKRGFTLLELVLALGLAIVILGMIGNAIHIYLVTLTQQQRRIEQRQVARNVVQMIGNDLRAALQYKPVDVTGIQDLAVSEILIAGILSSTEDTEAAANELVGNTGNGGGDDFDPLQQIGDTDLDQQSLAEEFQQQQEDFEDGGDSDELSEEDAALADNASSRPTMIGVANMVLVDVSRLPRIDEYNPLVSSENRPPSLPSDLKAVTYFVGEPESDQDSGQSVFSSEVQQLGGLYRRSIDRAVATASNETDIIGSADEFAELVAPEVVDIAFRYFDGEDWQEEWDNLSAGGFPLAIEITVTLDPDRVNRPDPEPFSGFDPETMQQYRSVVNLPASEIIPPEEN